MRIVSIFTNSNKKAVRLPKDTKVVEIPHPIPFTWLSLAESEKAADDFMQEREGAVVTDEKRIEF